MPVAIKILLLRSTISVFQMSKLQGVGVPARASRAQRGRPECGKAVADLPTPVDEQADGERSDKRTESTEPHGPTNADQHYRQTERQNAADIEQRLPANRIDQPRREQSNHHPAERKPGPQQLNHRPPV